MMFGKDFFKILNLVVQIMRLFAKAFGDNDDIKAIEESESRTSNSNSDQAC